MKLKKGFVLKELAGQCVVVSVDESVELNGIITLNATAKTLWLALEAGVNDIGDLVLALTDTYDVTEEIATKAVRDFVKTLHELNFLE